MNYSEKTVTPPHTFSSEEQKKLIRSAKSQEEALLKFFQKYPERKYTYYEIWQIFGWDKDSVKRSLSNLSNQKPSGPWRDGNGETPLLKLNEKRKNPKSGIRIHLFKYNPKYGRKLLERQGALFPNQKWGI